MRILLVEDEKHLSEAIAYLLKKNNYIVDTVYNGVDGYDYIKSDIYDIVILDVMLPLMDGFEILRRVRSEKYQRPILMLTSRSQVEDKVKGLDIGADDYLAKPFNMDELLARLRALGRRKSKTIESSELEIGDIIFLTEDMMRARYRESLREAKPVPEGEILRYEFDGFYWFSRRVAKGSRLRLVFKSSNSIDWQKNYNSGGVVAEESGDDARTAHVKLYHDSEHPSYLELPVVRD